jgi:hypothetical protein
MVTFGAVGRVWLGGSEEQIRQAAAAIDDTLASLPGRAPGGAAMTAAPIAPASPLDGSTPRCRASAVAALSSGGDYADLYFEHRSGADYVLEDGRIRTVGRGVTLGLACACCAATRPATRTPRSSTSDA